MQYNISPETILPDKKNVDITDLLDKKVDMSDGNCMDPQMAQCIELSNKVCLPRIIQKEYNDRTIYKKKMLEKQNNNMLTLKIQSMKNLQEDIIWFNILKRFR